MNNFLRKHKAHFNLEKFVSQALQEDLGSGDHTSNSTIPKEKIGKMRLLVKEEGIIAGVEAANSIIKVYSAKISIRILVKDGSFVKPGDVVFTLQGPVIELLGIERLILNIMQRMSAIASKTFQLQRLCKGTKAKVIDTRKTTPGFRFFEKWAVLIGGGENHRFGLYDMILIKDNHIDFAGGIEKAIVACKSYLKEKKLRLKIVVEVRSLKDIEVVLLHKGIERILIDNFTPATTKKAVKMIGEKVKTESSGGITEKNIAAFAKSGVDFISVGAITHHVKSLDLSLKAY